MNRLILPLVAAWLLALTLITARMYNPIKDTPEEALVERIRSLEKSVEALKTNQDPALAGAGTKYGSLRLVKTGTGTVAGTNNSASALWTVTTTTVSHNLGYKPLHLVTTDIDLGGGFRRALPTAYHFNGARAFPWETYLVADVTDTDLVVRFYTAGNKDSSGTTATFRYYLFEEVAN